MFIPRIFARFTELVMYIIKKAFTKKNQNFPIGVCNSHVYLLINRVSF